MPTHEGLGPDDRDGFEDRWKPSVQEDQEQPVAASEPDATGHLPLQYGQLMPERYVLYRKPTLRLERRGEQGQEKA
jgi:hypothetical protein